MYILGRKREDHQTRSDTVRHTRTAQSPGLDTLDIARHELDIETRHTLDTFYVRTSSRCIKYVKSTLDTSSTHPRQILDTLDTDPRHRPSSLDTERGLTPMPTQLYEPTQLTESEYREQCVCRISFHFWTLAGTMWLNKGRCCGFSQLTKRKNDVPILLAMIHSCLAIHFVLYKVAGLCLLVAWLRDSN